MLNRAPELFRNEMTAGRISSETRLMTLINGLSAGPGRVLERVADRVADDRGAVGIAALAAVVAVLDVLLGVVPRTTGVRQEVRHQLTGEDHRGEERAEGEVVDAEADDHGREHREQRRRGELTQRRRGADVDDRCVVGTLLARS